MKRERRRSLHDPYFENLDKFVAQGSRGTSFAQRMHPNPRFYKYYWHVFSRSSAYEGGEFFTKCKISTYEAVKEMDRLRKAGEPYMVYNGSLPRSGSDTSFSKKKSEHWAPPYDDDPDQPLGGNGHK